MTNDVAGQRDRGRDQVEPREDRHQGRHPDLRAAHRVREGGQREIADGPAVLDERHHRPRRGGDVRRRSEGRRERVQHLLEQRRGDRTSSHKARVERNPAKRHAMYQRIQQIVYEESPFLVLDYSPYRYAHGKWVHGFHASPLGNYNLSLLTLTVDEPLGGSRAAAGALTRRPPAPWMRRYSFLGRRILQTIPVLLGITVITFFLLRLIPGDPAHGRSSASTTRRRRAPSSGATLGLERADRGTSTGSSCGGSLHGDLGESINYQPAGADGDLRAPAGDALPRRVRGGARRDHLDPGRCRVGATRRRHLRPGRRVSFLIAFAMPGFWLGIIFILIFAMHLHLFPVNGYGTVFVGAPAVPVPARADDRAGVLDDPRANAAREHARRALESDYVDTARIKGISRRAVLRRHVLRNSIISLVVVFGINLAFLISGTVSIENVFAIPGVGRLLVDSVVDARLPRRAGRDAGPRVPRGAGQPAHRRRARGARPAGVGADERRDNASARAARPARAPARSDAAMRSAGARRS